MGYRQISIDIWLLICLLLVLLLQVYPLPYSLIPWRPNFVLILCCYVAYYCSASTALSFTLIAGLLTDIICGCVLGKHALALVLSLTCLMILLPRIKFGWIFHEAIAVGLITLVCGLVLQSLNLFVLDSVNTNWIIFPAISSVILWPFISWFFSKIIPSELV